MWTDDYILNTLLNLMPRQNETPQQFRKRSSKLQSKLIRERDEARRKDKEAKEASNQGGG